MTVVGVVPSPWSEAAKGIFRIAKLPVAAVRTMPGDREVPAWTGVDNAPVVMHDKEPPRTSWAAIVGLVARLAPGAILPIDPASRAEAMGLLDLIAGEDGLGWNGRLAMIHAGLTTQGARGFAPQVAGFLARRYGYTPAGFEGVRARVESQLAVLARHLGANAYLGGDRPSAVDVYAATFLTPLVAIAEADCPKMSAPLRQGFRSAAEDLGPLVPAPLFELRARMFERHLAWPLEI